MRNEKLDVLLNYTLSVGKFELLHQRDHYANVRYCIPIGKEGSIEAIAISFREGINGRGCIDVLIRDPYLKNFRSFNLSSDQYEVFCRNEGLEQITKLVKDSHNERDSAVSKLKNEYNFLLKKR